MEEKKPPVTTEVLEDPHEEWPVTPPASTVKKTSKFSIKAIISTIIFLLLAGGAAAGFVYREQISQIIMNPSPTPIISISPSPTESDAKMDILYANNGFEFYYPDNFEMYQALTDGEQWQIKSTKATGSDKEIITVLALHASSKPLPAIKEGSQFTVWTRYFDEGTKLDVNALTEEVIQIDEKENKIQIIDCGNVCQYAVLRFESNKKFYELIFNLNLSNLSTFKKLLSTLSFYEVNPKNMRTYISKEGKYSIQYPPEANFLEKVSWSVDGVRNFNSNVITIFPQKYSVSFKNIGDLQLDDVDIFKGCSEESIFSKTEFILNGERAIYLETGCGIEGSSTVVVKHKNILYEIDYTSLDDPFLETFKFID